MPLPMPNYLHIRDVALRWLCDTDDVVHYIKTGMLQAAICVDGTFEATPDLGNSLGRTALDSVTGSLRALIALPSSLTPPKNLAWRQVLEIYSLTVDAWSEPLRREEESLPTFYGEEACEPELLDMDLRENWSLRLVDVPFGDGWVVPKEEIERFEQEHGLREPITSAPHQASEKPLATKERATLLTIIAALAEEAKIDISKPSKAARLIENLTERTGARVAARTIEEHLKKIPDALENRASTTS
jgi:hypothetical protein